jgi:hypothetical protein
MLSNFEVQKIVKLGVKKFVSSHNINKIKWQENGNVTLINNGNELEVLILTPPIQTYYGYRYWKVETKCLKLDKA